MIDRIRTRDRLAEHELFWRFQPLLLRAARRYGVQPSLREECVVECLDDALLYLLRPETLAPRSLAGFLMTLLRNQIWKSRRGEDRRERHSRAAVSEVAGEYVVLDACSEAAVRESGAVPDAAPSRRALALLLDRIDAQLTDDERTLLTWLGQWVPQPIIAEWLGVEHDALRKRVQRLRARLRELSLAFADQLSDDDRRQLQRFFRRAGITDRRAANE